MLGKTNFYISSINDCTEFFEIRRTTSDEGFNLFGSVKMPVDTWYHLAYVFKDTNVSSYMNGTLSDSKFDTVASSTVNAVREPNFIGMGYNTDGVLWVSNIVLDEIKIFN
jgi:hypothetical protein